MLRIASAVCLSFASIALAAEPEGDLKALQGTWSITDAMLAAATTSTTSRR